MAISLHENRARMVMIMAIIFWSSAFVGIRYGIQSFSPSGLALLRYLVASVCMTLIYFFSLKKHPSRRPKEIIPVMLLGIIGFAAYNILLNKGEQQVSASVASFINGLTPVMVALLAIGIYGEKIYKLARWGFAISLLGILLMVAEELNKPLQLNGILITLTAILCGAIYSLLQKKMMFKMSPIEFTSYAIWGGTISMLIFMPELYHDLQNASVSAITVVIYMGIFPGALAYLFSSYSFKHLPVAQAASLSYLIPLFSTAFAFLFLKEVPSTMALIGGVVALIGSILVNLSQRRM